MVANKIELINELTNFVMNASDADNLIVSIFIAGMQAKENPLFGLSSKNLDRQPRNPPKQTA